MSSEPGGVTKRAADVLVAFVGLALLSPLFAILSAAIKMDSRGPVLFAQERIGIHKSRFRMLKFRTMRTDAPGATPTHLLPDPDRHITRVGRLLRRTSLDELPQLLNVLMGSMAIVGPRPALWNQADLIAERDRWGANDVRPGITGWAQVNGRDELSVDVKAKLDGDYIRMMSPWLDAKCIFWTVVRVLRRDGVVEGGADSKQPPESADRATSGRV